MLILLVCGSDSWMIAGYCVIGVILCGFYILIDLMMIMTPGAISYDDYILGAINLYIDMIRMFIYILAILGSKK
jgi:FtsH-binding integral membrane protein